MHRYQVWELFGSKTSDGWKNAAVAFLALDIVQLAQRFARAAYRSEEIKKSYPKAYLLSQESLKSLRSVRSRPPTS